MKIMVINGPNLNMLGIREKKNLHTKKQEHRSCREILIISRQYATLPSKSCAFINYYKIWNVTTTPANTIDTIVVSLIRMLIAGPDVSLNGSPTVSPTTAALWQSLPFPPWEPLSMYFFALSHAPPELAIMMASTKPVTVFPARSPATPLTPRIRPTTTGTITAIRAGAIIRLWADFVHMSTQAA